MQIMAMKMENIIFLLVRLSQLDVMIIHMIARLYC